MDYQYYKDEYKGTIRETKFYVLLPKAEVVLKIYIDDRIRADQLQDTLDGYGSFDKALCFEVDHIGRNSGTTAVDGASDLDLEQVRSSDYTLQMGNGGQSYKGIPPSPLAESVIMAELHCKGLLKLGWNW